MSPWNSAVVLNGSVTVPTSFIAGALTITADKSSNQFAIVQEPDGKVTLTGTNGTVVGPKDAPATSWTSLGTVTSIKVVFTAGTSVDKDTIDFSGPGVGTALKSATFSATKTAIDMDVSDVVLSGAFSLTTGINGSTTGGQLDLNITDSSFGSLSVDQTGCCPAHVSVSGTNVNGKTTIKEGWANGNSIDISDSTLKGDVYLAQYNGKKPNGPNCDGNGDTISVTDTSAKNLYISQSGDGKANIVTVDNVQLTPSPSTLGIYIVQGNGEGDQAHVSNVTNTFGNPNWKLVLCTSIVIEQGNGNSDSASVTDSTVYGSVSITQGNGTHDSAVIDNVAAGNKYDYYSSCGYISIHQGNGDFDTASITNSSTYNHDVSIWQGNGVGLVAEIDNVTSGGSIWIYQGTNIWTGTDPKLDPHAGNSASITNSTAVWEVTITQDDTAKSDGPSTALIDTVTASFICIFQGDMNGDSAKITNSIATLDYLEGEATKNDIGLWWGEICIFQGDGNGDHAEISCSTADTYVEVEQGDGNEDVIDILGVVAGTVDDSAGWPIDIYGDVYLTQGDGYHDVINVDECEGTNTTINNLIIYQGNNLPFEGCEPGLGDVVNISDTDVTSDIYIYQGYFTEGDDDELVGPAGFYTVNIGETSPVTAGGWTYISQLGESNTVTMNDFTTTWLDIWMGEGGGASASATNTTVILGSYLGYDFNIDAGGDFDGNIFIDFGNDGVLASDNFTTVYA